MNCPNCGADILPNQQYCRTCGAGLTPEARRAFNVRAWGLVALTLIFGGLLMAMGGKIWGVKWIIYLGLVIMFVGVFGIAAYGLLRETRPRKRVLAQASVDEPEVLRADTTNKLPPINESDFVPSVIDDTTELLETPVARRSASNE